MNERIKELMTQSGIVPIPNSTRPIYVQCPMSNMEKFAELIIKECAELNFRELGLSGSESFDVGEMIKQHFGVEI